jgi:hypothetical protein
MDQNLKNLESGICMMLEEHELAGAQALRQSQYAPRVMVYGTRASRDKTLPLFERNCLAEVVRELCSAYRACSTVVALNGDKKYLNDMRSDAGFYRYGFEAELRDLREAIEGRLLPALQELLTKETKQ